MTWWPACRPDCQAVLLLCRRFLRLSEPKVKQFSLQHRHQGARWGCRWKFVKVNMPSRAASVETDVIDWCKTLGCLHRNPARESKERHSSRVNFLLFLLLFSTVPNPYLCCLSPCNNILVLKKHHIDPYNIKERDFLNCWSPWLNITCCITEELACASASCGPLSRVCEKCRVQNFSVMQGLKPFISSRQHSSISIIRSRKETTFISDMQWQTAFTIRYSH